MVARFVGAVLVCLLLGGCATSETPDASQKNENLFPHFKLTSTDGSEFDSTQLEGKVVIMNFWATWCAPCRLETPWLVEYKNQYRERGFEIVGIALDPENKDEIAAFAKEFNINYPLVYSDGKIENESGGVLGVPTSYLIDRKGETIKKHSGIITNKEAFAKEIEALL
jgi:cytochrome c biogenesis protein CcmG/thiol:disulfide interchange protein DsbE